MRTYDKKQVLINQCLWRYLPFDKIFCKNILSWSGTKLFILIWLRKTYSDPYGSGATTYNIMYLKEKEENYNCQKI